MVGNGIYIFPIGFKASPYIYQTIGMVVTSYLRTLSLVIVQYIDNLLGVSGVKSDAEAVRDSFKVAYVLLQVLTRLGCTLSLEKMFFGFLNMCQGSWFPSGFCKTGMHIAR